MVRRRTAVSLAAAGLLLAAPALTACGSEPAHAGAAAVVGDHRIEESTLQSQVNDLRSAAAKSTQATQNFGSLNLSSEVLSRLVEDQVLAKAMADARLTVTDNEVQKDHDAALAQFSGSEAQLDEYLLANYGVAPDSTEIDHFFRRDVAAGEVIKSLGYQPGSDGGNTALSQEMVKVSQSLGVHINPRYGSWDPQKASIQAVKEPWVVDRTPVAAAAADTGVVTAQ
jgi:hypothetical protein